MLANLLGGFIVILVGVTLIPEVADSIIAARYLNATQGKGETNVSGVSGTLIGLTTIFYALGVMSAGVALAIAGLKNSGMM